MPEMTPYDGSEVRPINADELNVARNKFTDDGFRNPALSMIENNAGKFNVFCSRRSILNLIPEFDSTGKEEKDKVKGVRFQIGTIAAGSMIVTARSANGDNEPNSGYKDHNYISGDEKVANQLAVLQENNKFDHTRLADGGIRTSSFKASQLLKLLYVETGNVDDIDVFLDTVISPPADTISLIEFINLALYRTNEDLAELSNPCPPGCY